MGESDTKGKVLKKAVVWKNLYFYRKSDALYQLTVEFCHRFLPAYGDRAPRTPLLWGVSRGGDGGRRGRDDGKTRLCRGQQIGALRHAVHGVRRVRAVRLPDGPEPAARPTDAESRASREKRATRV